MPQDDFAVCFQDGMKLVRSNRYKQAVAKFTEAIQLEPTNALAYFERGRAWSHMHHMEEAFADLNHAVVLDPQFVDAYIDMGILYSFANDYEKAIAHFTQAIQVHPNLSTAYEMRAFEYLKMKDYEQAITDYDKAIALAPNRDLPYINRGRTKYANGDRDGALKDYVLGLSKDSEMSVGTIWGKLDESVIPELDEIILQQPNFAEAYLLRGLARRDDIQGQLTDFTEAIKLKLEVIALAYLCRGNIYRRAKNHVNALEDLSAAIHHSPDYTEAFISRGSLYAELGIKENSISDLQNALSLKPNHIDKNEINRVIKIMRKSK